MFCVIQEIETKKPNKQGYSKKLKSEFVESSLMGRYFRHYYGPECFERSVRKAYRISIHESYRENGKVLKRQFPICTVGYYDLATEDYTLYDWGGWKIETVAASMQVDEGSLYSLIEKKVQPLQEQIMAEFHQTKEYKVHRDHEKIITEYTSKKEKFNIKYETSGNEYDQCYDVFGTLHSPEKLKEIEEAYKARKSYENQSWQSSRSYYENFFNHYNTNFGSLGSFWSEKDKAMLKQFYHTLSKTYHPDSNPGKDTSEEMKLLNQLKKDWGL